MGFNLLMQVIGKHHLASVFVSDLLSATLVLIASISGLAVSLFSVGTMREERLKFGFFPIMHFLIMGLFGAFLAGDMFNLYVWFEVVIISSFVC
jgi:multicomponent Na+:H+ antiporter subunit D